MRRLASGSRRRLPLRRRSASRPRCLAAGRSRTSGARARAGGAAARPRPTHRRFARVTEPRAFRLPARPRPALRVPDRVVVLHRQPRGGRRRALRLPAHVLPPRPLARPAARRAGLAHEPGLLRPLRGHRRRRRPPRAAERFCAAAPRGLAGAEGEPFARLARGLERPTAHERGRQPSVRVARRGDGGLVLDLELAATKPLVAHGDRGLSPKSDEPGNASYYVGYTRHAARGTRRRGGAGAAEVAGEAWFDHEWSTSALGPRRRRLGLVLAPARRRPRADALPDPARGRKPSSPSRAARSCAADGRTRRLARERRDGRRSSSAGRARRPARRYPARWRLARPPRGARSRGRAAGSPTRRCARRSSTGRAPCGCRRHGRGRPVAGQGYVELTGYARSMQGVF